MHFGGTFGFARVAHQSRQVGGDRGAGWWCKAPRGAAEAAHACGDTARAVCTPPRRFLLPGLAARGLLEGLGLLLSGLSEAVLHRRRGTRRLLRPFERCPASLRRSRSAPFLASPFLALRLCLRFGVLLSVVPVQVLMLLGFLRCFAEAARRGRARGKRRCWRRKRCGCWGWWQKCWGWRCPCRPFARHLHSTCDAS